MAMYVLQRLLVAVPLLWAVATVTFLLMHAIPGGPFDREKPLPADRIAALEQKYHLDDPLHLQYAHFMGDLVRGDLGTSFRRDRPVTEIFRDGFPRTAQLGVCAFVCALAVGMPLGIVAALRRNSPIDYLASGVAAFGIAVPNFVIAAFLATFLAVELGWFDVLGWELGNYRKMVLPTVALGLLPAALIARITRVSLIETLGQEYVRTARAKGLRERHVIIRHALRNALVPILTVLGPIAATLVTGSFIIEETFAIGGIGTAFVDAVGDRDYGVIMGAVLLYALVIVLLNLTVDIAYGFADPRTRLGRHGV